MFFLEAGYVGTVGAGNGNYKLNGMSPLSQFGWKSSWVLPYDLDGAQRSALDPPGAFAVGVARHGGGQ
jgi:hypothetical protein